MPPVMIKNLWLASCQHCVKRTAQMQVQENEVSSSESRELDKSTTDDGHKVQTTIEAFACFEAALGFVFGGFLAPRKPVLLMSVPPLSKLAVIHRTFVFRGLIK